MECTHHIWSTHLCGHVGQEDAAMSINLTKEVQRFCSKNETNRGVFKLFALKNVIVSNLPTGLYKVNTSYACFVYLSVHLQYSGMWWQLVHTACRQVILRQIARPSNKTSIPLNYFFYEVSVYKWRCLKMLLKEENGKSSTDKMICDFHRLIKGK